MKLWTTIVLVLLLAALTAGCSGPSPDQEKIHGEGRIVAIKGAYYKDTPVLTWEISLDDGTKEVVAQCTFDTTPTVGEYYQVYTIEGDRYWRRISDKE
jgi:hypothetical protein